MQTTADPRKPFTAPPFRPAWGIRSTHAQTVAGRYLRRRAMPAFRRERVRLPDGDFVDLDFAPTPAGDAPLVLLLHGLEGSARRGYALNTYAELYHLGIAAVGLNFRSCSGEPNLAGRLYHSGETEDLRHVARLLRERYGSVPRGVVGFSLGGNAMLKFLGEEGERGSESFQAAVAVSVPYDLGRGADALDASRMGRLYTRLFVKSLVAKAEAKAAQLDGVCDMARVRQATSFREFDDAATAPIHGFAGAEDYYTRSSSRHFIARIRIPTLLLHALDDPFLPRDAFPAAEVDGNPCVQAITTERGGHVGFIGGTIARPRFWAEEQIARFMARHLLGGAA